MDTLFPTLPPWQIFTILSFVSWFLFARASLLTLYLRATFRPLIAAQVEKGVPLVLRLQKHMQHQSLDALFGVLSVLVSKEFYATFLPFLFWIGHCELARQMTLLMAFSLYIGNCIKDTISAPRPPCPPVRRFTATDSEKEFAMEYGFPSSHTINTICLSGYLLTYISRHFDVGGIYITSLVFLFSTLSVLTMLGRLYLGMHSPVDIYAGAFFGIFLLVFWCWIDESLELFISEGRNVLSFSASISLLLLFAYPTPELSTPSLESHTAFNGVALGVVSGVHRTYSQYHHENVAKLIGLEFSLHRILKRLVAGYPVILLVKLISKELAKTVLPFVCSLIGVPVKSSNYLPALNVREVSLKSGSKMGSSQGDFLGNTRVTYMQKPFMIIPSMIIHGEPFDIDIGIALLQYTGLGWAVVELVPCMFDFLGL